MIGHMIGHGMFDLEDDYAYNIEGLYTATGKYPMILGFGFGWDQSEAQQREAIPYILNWWDNGGLVEAHWATDNPWTGNYWKDSYRTNLTDLTLSTSAGNAYRADLDVMIGILDDLRLKGVQVLWRIGFEQNFSVDTHAWWSAKQEWWSYPTTVQNHFITWWQYTHNRMTGSYGGLDNLIWVFSPTREVDEWTPVETFWPGDAYVDIGGVNVYHNTFTGLSDIFTRAKHTKALAFSEVGPYTIVDGSWDNTVVLAAGLSAGASYALWWSSWEDHPVSIIDNQNAGTLMNSQYAVCRGSLPELFEVTEVRQVGGRLYVAAEYYDGHRNDFVLQYAGDNSFARVLKALEGYYYNRKLLKNNAISPTVFAATSAGLPPVLAEELYMGELDGKVVHR